MAPGRALLRAVSTARRASRQGGKHCQPKAQPGKQTKQFKEFIRPTAAFSTGHSATLCVSRSSLGQQPFFFQAEVAKRCYSAASDLPPHEVLSMPALSPTMAQGNLAKWNKKEGDEVAAGDSICDIETDKATLSFDSQEDGFLAKILIKEGTKDVPVGTPVAIVVESADDVSAFKDYEAGAQKPQEDKADKAPPSKPPPKPKAAKKSPSRSYPPHMKLGMPALSPTMTQGNVATWQKNVGDEVAAGDTFCDIETDKATMAFESQEEGFLAAILVPSDTKDVPVGKTLAILVEEKGDLAAFADYQEEEEGAAEPEEEETATEAPAKSPPKEMKPYTQRIGPSARKILLEAGLDPWDIKGTGPHGIITKGDALAAAAAPPQQKAPEPSKAEKRPEQKQQVEAPKKADVKNAAPSSQPSLGGVTLPDKDGFEDIPNSNIRRIIARRLLESKQQIPHAYFTSDTTLDKVLALRKRLKEEHSVSVSVNDFVIRAAALALQAVPEANGSWDEKSGEIVTHTNVDVSVAVATDKGLITPIVKNAHQKTLTTISAEVKDLAARAREGKLKPDEFQGGTFTISNLGMFPVDEFKAIINPPQACILAVGRGSKVVEWEDSPEGGHPVVRTRLTATLSADNRVVDGEVAARFFDAFSSTLAEPAKLLL